MLEAINKINIKTLGSVIAALLLITGMAVTGTSLLIIKEVGGIGETWQAFDKGPATKVAVLSRLRGALGYGGMIHDLKNFVLRMDHLRIARIKVKINEAKRALKTYEALGVNEMEKAALDDIAEVIALYANALATAERMTGTGSTTIEIDKAIKINDRPALKAMAAIDAELLAANEASSAAVYESVSAVSAFVTTTTAVISVLLFGLLISMYSIFRQATGDRDSLAQEVEDRKMAQEALIEAKQNAEAANRAKSEFLANMSHELRTPLNAIIGFSELTQNQDFGPVGNPKYIEYAADINQSGNHLLDLINDILDLSAIEAEKLELNIEPVGLATQVTVAEQFLSRKAGDGGVRIINTVGMDTPLIMADKRRVKQVLTNLLSNAVKFTLQGGTVTISAGLDTDGCMAIVIADTGIGMDEAEIAEALEPFGRADSTLSRTHEGTGLGLPLSKSLVEAHGGTLEVESRPGKGATVTVRFPADRVIADPAA